MADGTAPAREPRRYDRREALLFGGVHGAVLAGSMVAALSQYGHTSRGSRRYDAAWPLVTACAVIVGRGERADQVTRTVRAVPVRWEHGAAEARAQYGGQNC
ncbi:hypothetical protein [Streptomyces rishiriensis]|uniref:Integral membrane protein n=1 Tax=Streptomyces rishiriensis TaxID=68264 RepID=A0ABU0NZX6_STRRH|nr:hypothetical protein [Streptomyces rishiriensis]